MRGIIKVINREIPYAFSRWGDGEVFCMEGKKGKNCDGHDYFTGLRRSLLNVMQDQNLDQDYDMGIGKLVEGNPFFKNYNNINWSNGRLFVDAYESNMLPFLFNCLNDSSWNVIYVGSNDSDLMAESVIIDEHIAVPRLNSWLVYDEIYGKLQNKRESIILFSSGMTSKVLIHNLWKENKSNIYLDMGSVLDPYCGRITRSYQTNEQQNK